MSKQDVAPWYIRHDDDEYIDEIHFVTVPRLKESEMSGDEWRTSAKVEFYRKGHLLKTDSYHDLRTALAFSAKYSTGMFPASIGAMGDIVRQLDEDFCFQPGCSNPWTVEYEQTHEGCSRCGAVKENQYRPKHRRFCDEHKYRGDSSLDDMDDHYRLVTDRSKDGDPAELSPENPDEDRLTDAHIDAAIADLQRQASLLETPPEERHDA